MFAMWFMMSLKGVHFSTHEFVNMLFSPPPPATQDTSEIMPGFQTYKKYRGSTDP